MELTSTGPRDEAKKKERLIVFICLAGMMICLVLLIWGDDLWRGFRHSHSGPPAGKIISMQRDARHRSEGSFSWFSASRGEDIFWGDAVFSGKDSSMRVEMAKGAALDLGENSLVVFDNIDGEILPNLKDGNFRLKIDGNVKLAINGELRTFQGRNSELQIFWDADKNLSLRVLKGKVEESSQAGLRFLAVKPASAPVPARVPAREIHIWRLYELYANEGGRLSAREPLPELEPNVEGRFLPGLQPALESPLLETVLNAPRMKVVVGLRTSTPALGFIIESSLEADFIPGRTVLQWSFSPRPTFSLTEAGSYYYRFRGVGVDHELSDWSATQRINILPPPEPLRPKLAHRKRPRAVPRPTKPVAEPDRQIASLETSNAMKAPPPPEILVELNQKYRHSRISTQGFLWMLESSEQAYQAEPSPVATGLGFDFLAWLGNWGLQGALKTGVFSMNQAGQKTSLRDAEARIHYRFLTGFPFGLARELQVSLFLGAETYRNSGASFVNSYDLVKTGFSLHFPLSRRWSTGGEMAFGQASEGSIKQEISGHLNYFMTRDWSLGVGYHLNFFEARSALTAPGGLLPYKEGYGEGYSNLNYHF